MDCTVFTNLDCNITLNGFLCCQRSRGLLHDAVETPGGGLRRGHRLPAAQQQREGPHSLRLRRRKGSLSGAGRITISLKTVYEVSYVQIMHINFLSLQECPHISSSFARLGPVPPFLLEFELVVGGVHKGPIYRAGRSYAS